MEGSSSKSASSKGGSSLVSTSSILSRLSSKASTFVNSSSSSIKVGAGDRSTAAGADDAAPTILSVRAAFASASDAQQGGDATVVRGVSSGTQVDPPPAPFSSSAEPEILPPISSGTKGGKSVRIAADAGKGTKGGSASADVLQEAFQLVSLLEAQLEASTRENSRLRKQQLQQSPISTLRRNGKFPQMPSSSSPKRQEDVLSLAYNVLERGDEVLNGLSGGGEGSKLSRSVLMEEEGEGEGEEGDDDTGNQNRYGRKSRYGDGYDNNEEEEEGNGGAYSRGRGLDRRRDLERERSAEREAARDARARSRGSGRGNVSRSPVRKGRNRSQSTERARGARNGYNAQRHDRDPDERQGRRAVRDERERDSSRSRSQSMGRQNYGRTTQPHQASQRIRGGRRDESRDRERWEPQAQSQSQSQSQAVQRRPTNRREMDVDDGEMVRWVRLGSYNTFKAVQDAKRLRVRNAAAATSSTSLNGSNGSKARPWERMDRSLARRIILPSSVGEWPTVLHYKASKASNSSRRNDEAGTDKRRRFQIIFDRARGQWVLEGEARVKQKQRSIRRSYPHPQPDVYDDDDEGGGGEVDYDDDVHEDRAYPIAAPSISKGGIRPTYLSSSASAADTDADDDREFDGLSDRAQAKAASNPTYQELLDRLYSITASGGDKTMTSSSEVPVQQRRRGGGRDRDHHQQQQRQRSEPEARKFGHAKLKALGY